jgi:hypothetical protein
MNTTGQIEKKTAKTTSARNSLHIRLQSYISVVLQSL